MVQYENLYQYFINYWNLFLFVVGLIFFMRVIVCFFVLGVNDSECFYFMLDVIQ